MLLQEHSSCLCRGENGKPFCLAELWPCTNTRRRSKLLDLNACHILPLQIQLSGGLKLKLQNFILAVLPFRRIKKTNVQSLYWSSGFIDISTLTPSTRSKIQKKNYFGFTNASSKFISAPRKAKHFIGQLWQLMTVSNVGGRTQAWQAKWVVFKIPGFVCKRFLPFFLTPSPLFYLRHFSRGLWLSFLVFFSPKPHRNACYAGYSWDSWVLLSYLSWILRGVCGCYDRAARYISNDCTLLMWVATVIRLL